MTGSNEIQTNSGSKVFSLFTNFLSRTKSGNEENSTHLAFKQSSSIGNTANLKNLKRASSSSQFSTNKSQSGLLVESGMVCDTSLSPSGRSLSIFNPSSLFAGKSKSGAINKDMIKPSSSSKLDRYRCSSDNFSNLSIDSDNDTKVINKFDENTTLSTKNNGLIFLPTNPCEHVSSHVKKKDNHKTETINYENIFLGSVCNQPSKANSPFSASNIKKE